MANSKKTSEILDLLHKNCRLSLEEMATMLEMSAADLAEEITALESSGVIMGYGAKINWDKADTDDTVTAYIELKITPQRNQGFDRIAERIYQYPQVKALNLMSGSYDFGITIEGKSIKDVALFVSEHLAPMEAVLSTATHFVLKRYKYDGEICAKPEKDEREVISI